MIVVNPELAVCFLRWCANDDDDRLVCKHHHHRVLKKNCLSYIITPLDSESEDQSWAAPSLSPSSSTTTGACFTSGRLHPASMSVYLPPRRPLVPSHQVIYISLGHLASRPSSHQCMSDRQPRHKSPTRASYRRYNRLNTCGRRSMSRCPCRACYCSAIHLRRRGHRATDKFQNH